jgi:4-hydroxybenzoate polyprenyltransferase
LLKIPFIAFLKLIRIENLLIIIATQICIKYCVASSLNAYSKLTPILFSLLIFSTVLIAAAGYIINDYFDVKTDKINRPETVVLDVSIKRRWAMVLHIVFNSIGLLIGIFLAFKCHKLSLVFFQMFSITLLWFYSTNFKKQLLVGNIVVSILTATIPLMPLVYDYYISVPKDMMMQLFLMDYFVVVSKIVLVYSAFAFLTSFAREVIKDMEDYKGDIQTGCKTMPIVWGMITSKVVTFFTIVISIGILLLAVLKFYKDERFIAMYYIIGLLIIPLILLIIQTVRSKTSKDFKIASLLLKFTMLFGIAFTLLLKN